MSDYMCPECQMAESAWPDDRIPPVVKDGNRYCCTGCAVGFGCICHDRAPTREEIAADAPSQRLMWSLQDKAQMTGHRILHEESLRGLLDELMAADGPDTQMVVLRRWIAALLRWTQVQLTALEAERLGKLGGG